MKAKILTVFLILGSIFFSIEALADDGKWERVGYLSRFTMIYDMSVCNIFGARWLIVAESSGTSYIWRSSDNGANWQYARFSGVPDHYYKQMTMNPTDGNFGWALIPGNSDNDPIAGGYRTIDGGANWSGPEYSFPPGTSKRFRALAAVNTCEMLTAYLCTYNPTKIFKTDDGGAHGLRFQTGLSGDSVTDIVMYEADPLRLYGPGSPMVRSRILAPGLGRL